uniref:Uncharacterized protein n=1 Tax=Odontella aurita TaxID=265563 RepID=A0A7S4JPP3_9STRA
MVSRSYLIRWDISHAHTISSDVAVSASLPRQERIPMCASPGPNKGLAPLALGDALAELARERGWKQAATPAGAPRREDFHGEARSAFRQGMRSQTAVTVSLR